MSNILKIDYFVILQKKKKKNKQTNITVKIYFFHIKKNLLMSLIKKINFRKQKNKNQKKKKK